MRAHSVAMADYNAWANARLYAQAAQLSDEQYRRDVGVFFKSLHGTFNHSLVAEPPSLDLLLMQRERVTSNEALRG